MKTASHLLSLLTAMLLLATIALRRDGRLLGHSPVPDAPGTTAAEGTAFLENRADGTVVINTAIPGAGINGYMGPTPLYIHLKDGLVTFIEAQPNQDTPEFFSATLEDGFREKWYGKTPQEALAVAARPVTGATYSSTAFIQNVQAGLAAYLSAQGESAEAPAAAMSGEQFAKLLCGVLVALAAAILPLLVKHKFYRPVQLVLNVLVLGFWCGTFVSHTLLVKFLSQGIRSWETLLPVLLLGMAFVYPFFGRKSHYCMHACPFGSLQELVGKIRRKKLAIPPALLAKLEIFRQLLWSALLFVMLCGSGFAWMDCEPFAAFLVRTAPAAALVLAVLFLVLSLFVQRPYCRFVCPTGSLLKFAEHDK